jgi:hypothetical protein
MTRLEAIRERFIEYRPTKTHAVWFGVGCIAATLIVGFGFAGWVTGGSTQKQVAEASANARHELAAAVCVDEFMAAKDAGATLAKLKEAGWYDRGELVAKGGWATMPDRKEPNSTVASLCAAKLAEMTLPAAGATRTSTPTK